MARAQGARAQMALAFETTYGTPPVSGFTKMPFASTTLGAEQPLQTSELLGYGIDADLLDGSHASAFARLSGATFSGVVTAPNFVSSSDARLKSDIAPITEALAKVQALTGVTFTMMGSDTRQMGLIAQDVQAVAPEAVVETEGVLRLAYGNLVGLLVEAIKDLAQEVDQLKRTAP